MIFPSFAISTSIVITFDLYLTRSIILYQYQ